MEKSTKLYIKLGRTLSILSILAFVLTWFVGSDGVLLGRNASHLFNDAIVLGILSIFFLLDGYIHSKGL
jgi:hypothetical protein